MNRKGYYKKAKNSQTKPSRESKRTPELFYKKEIKNLVIKQYKPCWKLGLLL